MEHKKRLIGSLCLYSRLFLQRK